VNIYTKIPFELPFVKALLSVYANFGNNLRTLNRLHVFSFDDISNYIGSAGEAKAIKEAIYFING